MAVELILTVLLVIMLIAVVGLLLGVLSYVDPRSRVDRRAATRAETLRVETQIDRLTRETLQQMRDAARQALRSGGDSGA